jgi:hypothetical protein
MGWLYDTVSAMTRLVFSGLFDRHPHIKIVTHHLGGFVPYATGRIEEGYDKYLAAARARKEDVPLARHPHDYFREVAGGGIQRLHQKRQRRNVDGGGDLAQRHQRRQQGADGERLGMRLRSGQARHEDLYEPGSQRGKRDEDRRHPENAKSVLTTRVVNKARKVKKVFAKKTTFDVLTSAKPSLLTAGRLPCAMPRRQKSPALGGIMDVTP